MKNRLQKKIITINKHVGECHHVTACTTRFCFCLYVLCFLNTSMTETVLTCDFKITQILNVYKVITNVVWTNFESRFTSLACFWSMGEHKRNPHWEHANPTEKWLGPPHCHLRVYHRTLLSWGSNATHLTTLPPAIGNVKCAVLHGLSKIYNKQNVGRQTPRLHQSVHMVDVNNICLCMISGCPSEEETGVAAAKKLCTLQRKSSVRANFSTSPVFSAVSYLVQHPWVVKHLNLLAKYF